MTEVRTGDDGPVADLPRPVVEAIIAEVEPGAELVSFDLVRGGLSSFMHHVRLTRPDGSPHDLMIRRSRRPDHDRWGLTIEAEFAVVEQMHARGLPVPTPRLVDTSGRFVREHVAVLDRVEGAPRFVTDEPGSTGVAFAEVLALVHTATIGSDGSWPLLPHQLDRARQLLRSPDRPLDESLDEGTIRRRLAACWPPADPPQEVLLHGDFFPGNVLWHDGDIVAVIDWEDAAVGDPLADVAITRLDLWWTFGVEAADAFRDRYLALTGADAGRLAPWELSAALRPMGDLPVWAADNEAMGAGHMTVGAMQAVHRAFVADAITRC